MNATRLAAPSHASRPGPTSSRRAGRRRVVALLVALAAAVVLALALGLPVASPPTAPTASAAASDEVLPGSVAPSAQDDGAGRPGPDTGGDQPGAGTGGGESGAEDGRIVDDRGVSPFDAGVPALANLEPDLRAAVQQAARDARDDGITLVVTSGWRDERYQQWLYQREVDRSGAQAAEGLVVTGSSSRHLTGQAVDVGATDAAYWMSENGADHGLCQVYANEIWHYGLATVPGGTCPQAFADAADRP